MWITNKLGFIFEGAGVGGVVISKASTTPDQGYHMGK